MTPLHRNEKQQNNSIDKDLHPRNVHKRGYNFSALVKNHPLLEPYVKKNTHGNLSIDFSDPNAVKILNTALLKQDYKINDWDIPEGALCPAIPGRADYIHHVADLLGVSGLKTNNIKLLDIGTGASGIYPLLASTVYGWQCTGSDINLLSLKNVTAIITNNPRLKNQLVLRKQEDKHHIFEGIIKKGEFFDVTVCNPPFHTSAEEALKGSQRKVNNLSRNRRENTKIISPVLNFGGLEAELWCNGGERLFLKKLIKESKVYSEQCHWFTSLVSKIENLKPARKQLEKLGAIDIREIGMTHGNKITRVLAWKFH